ncbi:VCBS repeat-containing protein [Spirosoma sp. BT702]|uniref:VCBS repeat-containing protein n=1 Tax=Spirosoma profusum TaxID=2771354 RepID=A0A926XZ30_9BACT|nr:FG-GAP-like repeat-containing protein [Spirosoma profusum]MBD2703569.1 VCBS repeat-containing protein [Spirosoma profusum]
MLQLSSFYPKTRDKFTSESFHESYQFTDPRSLPTLARWGLLLVLLTGLSGRAVAQCFQTTTNYATGFSPRSVAVGDFNSDGKVDLAVSNFNSNNVSVLLGDGLGGFGTPTNFATQTGPQSVAVGDVNADGKLDLVIANLNSNTISVLLGDGAGNFASSTNFATGISPTWVVVGDVNTDGKVDLVVANAGSNNVSVLLGDGAGSFSPPTNFATGTNPQSVAMSDVNADGKVDLVIANLFPNNVSVLLGDGAGSFGTQTNFAAGTGTFSVAVSDVNGDGKADLVTANRNANTVSILLGNGDGSFSPKTDFATGTNPYTVAVSDINADGKLDLVTANRNSSSASALLGDGLGNFGPPTNYATGTGSWFVTVGDVNTDGKVDLITANNNSNDISVLLNCTVTSLSLITSATPNPVCAGTSTALIVTAFGGTAPYSYTWAAPAGITLSATSTSAVSASVDAGLSGPQTLTVTVAAAGGSPVSTSLVSLTVNAAPTVSISPGSVTLTCASPTASLMAGGSGTYQWTDGTTTQSISATSTGTYSVTLTDGNGCTATASAQVFQDNAPPTVSISPSSATLTCASPTASLTAIGTGTYQWSTGATTQVISVTSATTYSVTLTGANGCTATASAQVFQNNTVPAVNINPTSATLTCTTPTVSLSAVGSGTYRWSTGATTSTISVTAADTYSVTLTGANGCSRTASVVVSQDKNPPAVSITPNSATLTCASPSVSLSAVGTGTVLWSTGSTSRVISVSLTGDYTVALKGTNGCQAMATVTVSQDKNAPSVSINPASATLSCASPMVSLSAVGTGTYRWSTGATTSVISVTAAATYSVTLTGSNGCTAVASRTVGGNTTLAAPTLQASATSTTNQPISVTASGCSGTISWQAQGGAGTANGSIYTVTQPGSYTLSATCSLNSCTSAPASVTLLIQPAPIANLKVFHQDVDNNQTQNNTIKPYLQVQNDGSSPVPYSEITIRYWLTVEQFSPMTNLSVYWAQLGTDKVKMKYVELSQPRQGALGYIEYSFLPTAGNLAAGQNSGPIQNGIGKQDWTNFNESDDYSYANNANYVANSRITAYRNGTLVWGTEPNVVNPIQSLKIYTENKNGPSTNTINTYLQLRNEGNVGVNYADIKVRYYFTSEGMQPLNFYLDNAQLGSANVKGQIVRISPPLANADTYLELSVINLPKLYPLTSTGNIEYRIAKQDWSQFNQSNDYSYLNGTNPMAVNNRVVVYVGGVRVWGTEPGASAREGVDEPSSPLNVVVLGNPVVGETAELDVRGAEGQSLQLELTDSQGRRLYQHAVTSASSVERISIPVGSTPGLRFVQVRTGARQQTVKLLKR